MDYQTLSLDQLLKERHELQHELAKIKHKIELSSARYHEEGIKGDRYEYVENQHDVRALESDIQYLSELISQRKKELRDFQVAFHKTAKEELDNSTVGFLTDIANQQIGQ